MDIENFKTRCFKHAFKLYIYQYTVIVVALLNRIHAQLAKCSSFTKLEFLIGFLILHECYLYCLSNSLGLTKCMMNEH